MKITNPATGAVTADVADLETLPSVPVTVIVVVPAEMPSTCPVCETDATLGALELYEKLREPRMAPPPRIVAMRNAGLLGRKSGRGFYRYD